MRVEENSGVQRIRERRIRCGEIKTGISCGEGPARKEGGPTPVQAFCSRNAHDRNMLVRRPQSGLTRVSVPRRSNG